MAHTSTTLLLNPHRYDPQHFDAQTRRLLQATIDWFEQRGKRKLVADYHAKVCKYSVLPGSCAGLSV